MRVADAQSFTRAANSLQLPRTTVTTAIQKLESELGTQLLLRTTRQVQLTQDGSEFYERCAQLLTDYERATALFRPGEAAVCGRLRVDVPGRVGRLLIAPALPAFFARFPDIELELGVSDHPVDLIRDGVDCAVRVGTLDDSGLVMRRIGLLEQINCASPDYLRHHGTPRHPKDLATHLAVNYALPSSGRIDDWEYVDGTDARRITMKSRVVVNSAEAYIACCIAGLGLIQIPAYDVADDLAEGRLVELMPQWRPAPMPVSLLYPHRRHSERLRVFVDWCEALLVERMQLRTAY